MKPVRLQVIKALNSLFKAILEPEAEKVWNKIVQMTILPTLGEKNRGVLLKTSMFSVR